MTERRILTIILLAFLLLGGIYTLNTPVFEASDELWHYPMIRHLADGNPLPVQVFDPTQAGPWKQEASQPPLYYYLGAALTFWVDTSDMDQVRRLNPHVDNGVITADGNINLVVHDPSRSPWRGTLLAVRIVRLASVLMGLVTVYFTYRITRELWPGKPVVALGAAAMNAFTPMFLFISGAVNNDNLAIALASWSLYLMIGFVKHGAAHPNPMLDARRWLGLGIVIGLAVLTKEGTLGLLPMALGTAAVVTWQELRSRLARSVSGARQSAAILLTAITRGTLLRFMLVLGPVMLIAGWWYYRNLLLYGDWLGWNAFVAVLGERPQPATLAQLWGERWGFLASYWGLFGGVNVPMPTWIYSVLNGVLVIAVPGFLFYAGQSVGSWRQQAKNRPRKLAAPTRVIALVHSLLDFVVARFALVVCVLFSIAVIVGLISWATTTWSSQGRLAFTAISTLSALLAVGLMGWLPPAPARNVAVGLGVFLFLVAVAAPFLWIAPAYQPSQIDPVVDLQPVDVTFGGRLKLEGYAIDVPGSDQKVQPGSVVDVYLQWRVLQEMARDWSVFVHLNDPVLETPLAQRDMYLGSGLLATSFLEPETTRVEHYRLAVPQTAMAPATLELVVGIYDFYTDERLTGGRGDAAVLEQLVLQPLADASGNQLEVNFGNELALVAYSLPARRLAPGEPIELTLTWTALHQTGEDYALFAQLLNAGDTTRWAAEDRPTTSSEWEPGEEESILLSMPVREDTPPGIYTLVVGAYTRDASGGFRRLQIVRDGRLTMDDVLQLARIRVE